jgi:[ribosomal protein S18]-alanine N-acetyltransferase
MVTTRAPLDFFSKVIRGWDRFAWRAYRFQFPKSTLPAVHVRSFRKSDLDACCEIYRLNEPENFPEGWFDHFRKWLTGGRASILVVEGNGEVVGFGGVTFYLPVSKKAAGLSFGMVHPHAQGRGIGTVLLLARIAVLPEPDGVYALSLSAIPKSESFFRKFGFGFVRSFRYMETGDLFNSFAILIRRRDWRRCRVLLNNSGVTLPTETVVSVPFKEMDALTRIL